MNILIISQYFWPESFRINDLALGLQERGYKINVLTGKPNYPGGKFHEGYSFWNKHQENWKGIEIYRSKLFPRGNGSLQLMLNYSSFAFFASIRTLTLKKKYDLIFVFEPSPITVGIPAVLLSKRNKIPVYFWVQDLWPESLVEAGQIKNKVLLNQTNKLTKWIYRNSKKIFIQSRAFKEYIMKQGVLENKLIYFPNSTESLYKPIEAREGIKSLVPDVPFKVMFAGNIGEAQDFETIMTASKIIQEQISDIHFIILGDGRKRDYVEKKVEEYDLETNFHLLGAFPVRDMPHFFSCADALLVTLKRSKIFSHTIPSKVQSYLACGKPIIASLDGEGARVIEESRSGLVGSAGSAETLAKNIIKLYKMSPEERERMSKNGREYFEKNFEREKLLDQLIDVFEDKFH